MKITEDFIGNETKTLTKTKISTILRWWGFNPDSYSTWGNARSDMNNILSVSSSSTISDRERASSFLSKINYINDTDTVIGDMLFASNEPGVWYDPSDLSTLFQDAAGTTPVTGVEQPVGLMLDKSKGLVRGPERLTNGDFSAGSQYWTVSNANETHVVTFADGKMRYQSDTTTQQLIVSQVAVEVGKTYEVTVVVSQVVSGALKIEWVGNQLTFGTVGVHRAIMKSSSVSVAVTRSTTNVDMTIDSISVRELPGNHASQPTTTARPILSARVNLLTQTEDLRHTDWPLVVRQLVDGTTTAPDGTNTAYRLSGKEGVIGVPARSITAPTGQIRFSLFLRHVAGGAANITALVRNSTTGTNLVTVHLALGGSGTTSLGTWEKVSVGDNWFKIDIFITSGLSRGDTVTLYFGRTDAPQVGQVWDVWHPDVRAANDGINLPPYQRVNTATDYDTQGFPCYLRFDGVDDWLVTNTITPNTDKAQVFAGLRKLSDAAIGMVIETSTDAVTNNGAISLRAPWGDASTTYQYLSRGTVFSSVVLATVAAPRTDVLTGTSDISGDSVVFRVNGIQAGTSNVDQGASNYLAYPIFIGRRGGTALSFNGHLYSLIVRFGPNLPIETIEKTEKYINGLTKAY